jgi:2-polyprenyl-3-methyl-5-hydroxy-6-metoxy-1,4-benzoquinol methylase
MNDSLTTQAYEDLAKAYSEDWNVQPEPVDMYDLFKKFLIKGGSTAEIGCGNGRDANWLTNNGFIVDAFDSSKELIRIARNLYPNIHFGLANLPELREINGEYDNVVCETVIMHLPTVNIPTAIHSLRRLLKPCGIMYLSWRVTEGEDVRHSDGRLYSAFAPELVLKQFNESEVLHFEDKVSASSGKRVCRLII